MRLDNVIAIIAYFFIIIVLDSIVFTLLISNLNVTKANANSLSLLNNVSNLVNTLRVVKAHKVRKV